MTTKLKIGEVEAGSHINLANRDAFHVPGIVVVARVPIEPGSDIKFECHPDEANYVIPATKGDRHAIADPFVPSTIPSNACFWALLLPESINNLIHNFNVVDSKFPPKSEEYLEQKEKEEAAMECLSCWSG